ncbi:MAG: butyrate kinase [Sphaerochaetaceae bacterium]|nr:butyrate kinase [Sphaerochaetaceae bacterium]
MKNYHILVINPGSTSTKISVFRNMENLFTESIFHDASVILQYPTVNDQLPFRRQVILDILKHNNFRIEDIDVYIGRGGCAYSQPSKVIEINKALVEDTASDKGGSDHPSKLGVMLAYDLGTKYNKPMYSLNPINVDEFCDYARITGIKGLYRHAQSHCLNQKAIASIHAKSKGSTYEEGNYIVCHIDGGISITAHEKGLMIDGTEGAAGEGPFSPTRVGTIPVMEMMDYMDQGHDTKECRKLYTRTGGFVSHFGTSNSDIIHKMVEEKDPKATLIWNSMCYNICKSIGEMAAVLEGKVDGILLTGGLVRFKDLVAFIEKKCSWIAPIFQYPGEVEQEALAEAALEVMEGKVVPRQYTGKPVFSGFPWDN